jgi:hypothetical protein
MADSEPGGDKGVGRNNYLVARADPQRTQGKVQRVQAIRYGHSVRHTTVRCELGLESLGLMTQQHTPTV